MVSSIQPKLQKIRRDDVRTWTENEPYDYEMMNMIRKGQIEGIKKGDVKSQVEFIKPVPDRRLKFHIIEIF